MMEDQEEMTMYDDIVIGCGFAGAVVARELAEKGGRKVLIIDRRNHIGGNCYDAPDEHGILTHIYGPHIFHTNIEEVYNYLSRFTEWYRYDHEVVADIHGTYIPVPFNLHTVEIAFPDKALELKDKLINCFGLGSKVPVLKLREHDDPDIREIADYVYNNIFLKYTMKQWGQTPEEIDPSVTGRVPVSISYDDRYFQDKYQGMPLKGFTSLFEKMVDHENITIQLNTDIKDILSFIDGKILYKGQPFEGNVIFSGQIDELFDRKYGMLPYRTLKFQTEYHKCDSFLPKAVVNYTVSEDYTRISEYKKLTGQLCDGTTIMKEYSLAYTGESGQTPYYAIINNNNLAQYNKYKELADTYSNLYMLGRLAEYKYYNIDAIVKRALDLSAQLISE